MTRADIVSQWAGTVQFAVISTARRLKLSSLGGGELERFLPWDYVEVDNRGNKGATIYYAFNGDTVSSTLASGILTNRQSFRLPPDSIDRIFIRATSISAIATSNATTVFLTMGRY